MSRISSILVGIMGNIYEIVAQCSAESHLAVQRHCERAGMRHV